MFRPMRHAHALQSSGDKRLALTGSHPAISQRQLDVLKYREIPYQIEALKNKTNFPISDPRPFGKRKIGNFVSLQRIAAFGRGIEQAEYRQQGRFTTTGWS